MSNDSNKTRSASLARLGAACLALSLALAPAVAQDLQGSVHGRPSASAGTSRHLSLSLANETLRLEGGVSGEAAILVIGTRTSDVEMADGGRLLVEAATMHTGRFDARGRFELRVTGLPTDGTLFVQGVHAGPNGRVFSAALKLWVGEAEEDNTGDSGNGNGNAEPAIPERFLVKAFGDLLKGGYLETALQTALNSDSDSIKLSFAGNLAVPVAPTITVGGKVEMAAAVSRTDTEEGPRYYLTIGADAAMTAGVGAGVAGVKASQGGGYDVLWRYESTHDVARAIRSMLILKCVGPRLEIVSQIVHRRGAKLEQRIATMQRRIDQVRGFTRRLFKARKGSLLAKYRRALDELRAQRRAIFSRARNVIRKVAGFVAVERIFINQHLTGVELRTTTGVEAGVSAGLGEASNINVEAKAEISRKFVTRYELDPTTRVMSQQITTLLESKMSVHAGFGVGIKGSAGRKLEIQQTTTTDPGNKFKTELDTVLRLQLDREVAGALGAFITGEFGIGGEFWMETTLEDVLRHGKNSVMTLLTGDQNQLVALLKKLPIKIFVRGHYRAGLAAGFEVKVEGVIEFGATAKAEFVDHSRALQIEVIPFVKKIAEMVNPENVAKKLEEKVQQLNEVKRQVQAVMAN